MKSFNQNEKHGKLWIERRGRGDTQAKVTEATRVSQSVIDRIWNHFLEVEDQGKVIDMQ